MVELSMAMAQLLVTRAIQESCLQNSGCYIDGQSSLIKKAFKEEQEKTTALLD